MPSRDVADWIFDRYVRRLTARHFSAVYLADLVGAHSRARLPDPPRAQPSVLFVANHSNWWDGFLAWLVSRELGLQFHILMEAVNLDRYWMFKWIGALPMHRGRAREAYDDLEAAGRRLERPGTSLWIFPQGERRPWSESVVGRTERGAAHLASTLPAGCQLIPVAFRYIYRGEQLPEAFILLSDPIVVSSTDRAQVARQIEDGMQLTVDQLDARLRTEDIASFRPILTGQLSINKRLDRVRHAAGTIDGPFERRHG